MHRCFDQSRRKENEQNALTFKTPITAGVATPPTGLSTRVPGCVQGKKQHCDGIPTLLLAHSGQDLTPQAKISGKCGAAV